MVSKNSITIITEDVYAVNFDAQISSQLEDKGLTADATLPAVVWNKYVKEATITNNDAVTEFNRIYTELNALCNQYAVELTDTTAFNSIVTKIIASVNGAITTPIGTVYGYAGSSAPEGYLTCDGSEFNADEYPVLFNILGTNILPDLRECVLVGVGRNTTHNIAKHDEYALNQFKDDAIASHTHKFTYGYNYTIGGLTGDGVVVPVSQTGSLPKYREDASATKISGTSGTSDVTRDKSYGVNYIIKAK